ncbi:MAG: SRPBCC domain-containing protein [Pseudomonadota bacterium]|nr:SRPBCC domain-containing protein [Pseudomonadota bacterium]
MTLPFLKSPPGETPVIVEGHFRATPARVFRAWTEPDEIVQWFGTHTLSSAEIDLRVGGTWRFLFADTGNGRSILQGSYTDVSPNDRLAFTWVHEHARTDGVIETTPESQVTITFAPERDGTFVRLVHAGIQRVEGRSGVGQGWNASFERLQAIAEGREVAA